MASARRTRCLAIALRPFDGSGSVSMACWPPWTCLSAPRADVRGRRGTEFCGYVLCSFGVIFAWPPQSRTIEQQVTLNCFLTCNYCSPLPLRFWMGIFQAVPAPRRLRHIFMSGVDPKRMPAPLWPCCQPVAQTAGASIATAAHATGCRATAGARLHCKRRCWAC